MHIFQAHNLDFLHFSPFTTHISHHEYLIM